MFYKVKTLIQVICNYPIEYRNVFRNLLVSTWKENLNFKTFFICFPVFFSISKTFYLKYQGDIFVNTVQKNLPGVTSRQTKITLQTYENIFSNQLKFQNLYNSLSLNTSHLSENKNTKLNQKIKNFQLVSDSCFKRVDFYNDFVLKKTNLNLDELPLKVQHIVRDENYTKSHLVKFQIINTKLQKNFYNKNILPYVPLHQKVEENSINFYNENQNFEIEKFDEEDIIAWIRNENDKNIIFNLLRSLEKISLITKNYNISPRYMSGYILPDIDNQSNVIMIGQFFYQKNNALLYKIFLNFFLNDQATGLNADKVKYSLTKSNSHFIKAEFLDSNLKLQPVNFELSSQDNTFKYFEKKFNKDENKFKFVEKTYQGPSILRNIITNEAIINNQEQVKEWLDDFFDSENPLSNEQKIFFGKNVYDVKTTNQTIHKNKTPFSAHLPLIKDSFFISPKTNLSKKVTREVQLFKAILTPLKNPKFNKFKNLVNPKPLKRTVYKPHSPVPSIKYRYIPYLTQTELDKYINEIKKDFFPFFFVQYPKKDTVKYPLNYFDNSYLKKLSHGSSLAQMQLQNNLLQVGLKNPKVFLTKLGSEAPLKQSLLQTQFLREPGVFHRQRAENTYKKQYTIYNKTFKKNKTGNYSIKSDKNKTREFHKSFHQSIEPINLDSWLFITQFSIGLFFVQIFQFILKKYEKELISFFSIFVGNENASLQDSNNDEYDKNNENSSFRIIKNPQKTFSDIVGINTILPELSEIVWFLRNSSQGVGKFLPSLVLPYTNKLGTKIPKGILLTGPPGTGKTLLVQAIAGESEVPILIESGSSLTNPETWETGPERLKNLFREARKMAPCIIFIDEIDTFGETRNEILENPFTNHEILNSIYPNNKNLQQNGIKIQHDNFIPQPNFNEIYNNKLSQNSSSSEFHLQKNILTDTSNQLVDEINQNTQFQNRTKQEQRNVLMQLLIELDGITVNNKILVFAATNRPQILDPALTRPGRFNKIFELKLPNKQKRLEILKFYSKNLGVDINVSWNYLANLTFGLSAADLASIMNQSSMKAIQTETFHTIETIEYGIECITGYTTQKNQLKTFVQSKKNSNKVSLFANRLAYYQAGKALVHTLLEFHPTVIAIHLWPQLKNPRYHLINTSIEKEFSQIHTRIQLESRIIGLYGGKAAEFLALFHGLKLNNKNEVHSGKLANKWELFHSWKSSKSYTSLLFWQSDLGIQDISLAGWLAQMMISKWYFYSKKISIEKFTEIQENDNFSGISDFGIFEFFKQLSYKTAQNQEVMFSQKDSQNWITKPWLQKQITEKLELFYFHKNNWFKIYSGDHERNENTRIIFPDKYYHDNVNLNNTLNYKSQSATNFLQKLPYSSLTWNNKNYLNRDYIFQSLSLSCFNKAISILDKNRELLDLFASLLMQKEIIRENEITEILQNFLVENNQENFYTKQIDFKINSKSKKKLKFVEKSWGKYSRKKKCRFINFQIIK